MNKKLYYTICSSVIGVFLIVWLALFAYFSVRTSPNFPQNTKTSQAENTNADKTEKPEAQNISSAQNTPGSEAYYLILCENSALNVYEVKNGEQIFLETLDINVSQMIKTDREEFMRGVRVNSKIELAHIIEDYAS